jgi:hypothetical protein
MVANWSTLAQLYYNGGWNQLPSLVDAATGVTLERGVADDLDVKPAICNFRLNDPTDLYRPSNAASSLYGQTGQYMPAAFSTGGSTRLTGETQYMNPGQTSDHAAVAGVTVRGNRWVDVRVGGMLTRVGFWRDPLASPLFTSITGQYATNLRGYFTLEDGRDSTSLANVSHPTKTGRFNGVTLANADGPGGSGPVLEMSATGSLTTPYAAMSTTAGWQLAFAFRTTTADVTLRPVWEWRTTNGYTWQWRVTSTVYNLLITDSSGATILNESYGHGTGAGTGQWIYTRVKVQIVAGNTQIEPSWYAEDVDALYGITTSYAGTNMGAPTQSTANGNVTTTGARYAHHLVVTGVSDDLESDDFQDAFIGYRRERAADRFARLCASRGLYYQVRGTSSRTARMGVQPQLVFQDQLKEIRITEGGLIFDRADNIGVILATRDYLYEQAASPALELTYPTHTAGTLEEVAAAGDLYNVVTAKNTTGSSSTAVLTTGRYGTANPPTGAGRLDKTVEPNLASDGPLADVANWWLRYWTQGGPRFDSISVDADGQPGLVTDLNAAEPGMFIRLTGRTPDPLLLLILSTGQKTHRKGNLFTFRVANASIFNVGVYDDAGSRYDSASTTLAAGATSTATTLLLTTRNYHDRWSTTSLPYPLAIAGERVTATAMTAAVSAGGVWTQTATVTRSVNAVVKAQLSGAQVQLADPVYYG